MSERGQENGGETETELLVSQAHLARSIGISRQRVHQLIQPGEILHECLAPDGRVYIEQAKTVYESNLVAGGRGADQASDLAARTAETKLLAAEEDLRRRQVQRAREEGQLVEADAMRNTVVSILGELRRALDNMGRDLAPEITGIHEPREVRAIMDKRVERIFGEAFDKLKDKADES